MEGDVQTTAQHHVAWQSSFSQRHQQSPGRICHLQASWLAYVRPLTGLVIHWTVSLNSLAAVIPQLQFSTVQDADVNQPQWETPHIHKVQVESFVSDQWE